MCTFSKKILSFDMNIAFSALSSFFFFLLFHRQQHFDIHHLIKMTRNAVNFVGHVGPEGWCHFKVMSTDRQVHE